MIRKICLKTKMWQKEAFTLQILLIDDGKIVNGNYFDAF